VDYRYKLDSIDLWETVVFSNNKNGVIRPEPAEAGEVAAGCVVAV
jgi:hypothetical protein